MYTPCARQYHNATTFTYWYDYFVGSTSVTADVDGDFYSETRYSAFGEVRYSLNNTPTDYMYTGQRNVAEIGLYYYVARFYDPQTAHFISADTVVPDVVSSLSYDRYAYTSYNPLVYSDPTGHYRQWGGGGGGQPQKPTTLIEGCGQGTGSQCTNTNGYGGNLPLRNFENTIWTKGMEVVRFGFEGNFPIKKEMAENILDYMNSNTSSSFLLVGHSANADAMVITAHTYVMHGGNDLVGLVLLDPTLSADSAGTGDRELGSFDFAVMIDDIVNSGVPVYVGNNEYDGINMTQVNPETATHTLAFIHNENWYKFDPITNKELGARHESITNLHLALADDNTAAKNALSFI